jgi:predicted peptidase
MKTLLLLLSFLLMTPVLSRAAAMETGFLNATVRKGELSLPYVVYVPRNYSADRRWPVILFLHGAGERGENGLPQTQVGIGTAIRMNPERFPCVVVMPQCPAGKSWGAGIPNFSPDAPDIADLALAALDETVRKYNGDPDRLYLTGLSMGGYGTWYIGSKHPGKFAALLPVCGGGRPAEMAPALKSIPIWAFHGDADTAVPVQRSREMVEAIKAAGGAAIKYTEYPGVAHNSWDRAYGDPDAITWLLSHKRGK